MKPTLSPIMFQSQITLNERKLIWKTSHFSTSVIVGGRHGLLLTLMMKSGQQKNLFEENAWHPIAFHHLTRQKPSKKQLKRYMLPLDVTTRFWPGATGVSKWATLTKPKYILYIYIIIFVDIISLSLYIFRYQYPGSQKTIVSEVHLPLSPFCHSKGLSSSKRNHHWWLTSREYISLEPETSIKQWLFQILDDSKSLQRKLLFNQTSI